MSSNWRAALSSTVPTAASVAGLLLVWWLRGELGWPRALLAFAGLVALIIGATSLHCYLRLRRDGLDRSQAFRHCLSWMRS